MSIDAPPAVSTAPHASRWTWWTASFVLVAAVALTTGVRLRVLDVALERDEGEYAYIAQLMLRGVPPYAEAYTMKLPGTPAMYALSFLVFGQTIRAVHLALLVANLAGVGLIYLLTARWQDRVTAAAAAAFYALWSLTSGFQGTSAHAEHFAVLFGLAGYLAMLRTVDPGSTRAARRWAWPLSAGALFGLAVVMKQQGAFLVAPAAIYLFVTARRLPNGTRSFFAAGRAVGWLALGGALPLVVLAFVLALAGVFPEFWFQTVTYAREYALDSPEALFEELPPGPPRVLRASWPLDGLLLVGWVSAAWDTSSRRGWLLWLCLLAGGIAATLPGLRFYEHYFVFLLPAASIYAALGLSALARGLALVWRSPSAIHWQVLLAALVIAATAWANRAPWFQYNMVAVSRANYSPNPFPEFVTVSQYLNRRAQPGDRLLVLGSEPQLYFYTGLPAATKYIYMYPMFERHPYAIRMQRELIEQVERIRPEYCVWMRVEQSWLPRSGAPNEIFPWWTEYHDAHYERIGVVDLLSSNETAFAWDEAARKYQPRSTVWIGVYRRRDLADRSAAP